MKPANAEQSPSEQMRRPKLKTKASWSVDIWEKHFKNKSTRGKNENASKAKVLAKRDKDSQKGDTIRKGGIYKG